MSCQSNCCDHLVFDKCIYKVLQIKSIGCAAVYFINATDNSCKVINCINTHWPDSKYLVHVRVKCLLIIIVVITDKYK